MRAFRVQMPSGGRYWTVIDDGLCVAPVADRFLRELRFGRDRAESTTNAYAGRGRAVPALVRAHRYRWGRPSASTAATSTRRGVLRPGW